MNKNNNYDFYYTFLTAIFDISDIRDIRKRTFVPVLIFFKFEAPADIFLIF